MFWFIANEVVHLFISGVILLTFFYWNTVKELVPALYKNQKYVDGEALQLLLPYSGQIIPYVPLLASKIDVLAPRVVITEVISLIQETNGSAFTFTSPSHGKITATH